MTKKFNTRKRWWAGMIDRGEFQTVVWEMGCYRGMMSVQFSLSIKTSLEVLPSGSEGFVSN